jgi:hypothetical protein
MVREDEEPVLVDIEGDAVLVEWSQTGFNEYSVAEAQGK